VSEVRAGIGFSELVVRSGTCGTGSGSREPAASGFEPRRERMAQTLAVTAHAEVTCWVSRGAAGDLAAGVRARLESVDAVAAVEELSVRGFRPTANDVRVDVAATLRVRCEPDCETAADALADGFAVLDAEVTDVE